MIRLNCRGETLVEVLVALGIGFVALLAVLSALAGSRAAAVESWSGTGETELAAQIMEQLKALPYKDLLDWERRYRTNGRAAGLDPRNGEFPIVIDERFDGMEAEFDLLPYEDVPLEDLLKIVVRTGSVELAGIRANR
ncbi:MAG: hypothetical protein BAA02_04520 [Paenibacillaceae bacterium ZCTH02-B3]|nr:MAG: hypothetical protein BAA02_04520 [Paenibacillaceae bacterium ZCTH02-B3]